MASVFESANYPTTEPSQLRAGDRWQWKRSDLGADYPPATHALTYRARKLGDGTVDFAITASASGSDYLVEEAASTTAALVPGTYAWEAYITRTSDSARATVATGTWEVLPDLTASTADPRSHARRTLAAIEAVIEDTATKEQASYSIAGRSLARRSVEELMALANHYRHLVAAETRRERMRRGLPAGLSVQASFR